MAHRHDRVGLAAGAHDHLVGLDAHPAVLLEGLDDWIPIDRVIDLSEDLSELTGDSIEIVLGDVLEFVLSRRLMMIGDKSRSGFESWDQAGVGVVSRVIRRLEEVGWRPQGGLCWLANTKLGNQAARRVGSLE
jgi:hypothetical protein